MKTQKIIELIEKTAKENLISEQHPTWGTAITQVDIFNAGIKELEYRLKRILKDPSVT